MKHSFPLDRRTRQREILIELLERKNWHPSAEELHQIVQREMPAISLGTIYRNMEKLAKKGAITVIEEAGLHLRYDGNPAALAFGYVPPRVRFCFWSSGSGCFYYSCYSCYPVFYSGVRVPATQSPGRLRAPGTVALRSAHRPPRRRSVRGSSAARYAVGLRKMPNLPQPSPRHRAGAAHLARTAAAAAGRHRPRACAARFRGRARPTGAGRAV